MRLASKPRMVSVPPDDPYGSLFWKATPGSMLIVSIDRLAGALLGDEFLGQDAARLDARGSVDPVDARPRLAGDDDRMLLLLDRTGRLGSGGRRHEDSGRTKQSTEFFHEDQPPG